MSRLNEFSCVYTNNKDFHFNSRMLYNLSFNKSLFNMKMKLRKFQKFENKISDVFSYIELENINHRKNIQGQSILTHDEKV